MCAFNENPKNGLHKYGTQGRNKSMQKLTYEDITLTFPERYEWYLCSKDMQCMSFTSCNAMPVDSY